MPECLFIVIFSMSFNVFAQSITDTLSSGNKISIEKNLSILGGYNFWNNHFAETGVAINHFRIVGHHPADVAYFISNEIKIDNKLILGPKIGIWFGGGIIWGLNLIYYTDFNQSSLRFRPEIGLGLGQFKFVYGYNIPVTNKNFEGINKNNISIVILFNVKKLKVQ